MTKNKLIITLALSALAICTFAREFGESGSRRSPHERSEMQANPEAKLHRFPTTIEKERPGGKKKPRFAVAQYPLDLKSKWRP